MNLGGLHLFAGLFFLVCCMAITIFYVYVVYILLVAIRKLFRVCSNFMIEHMITDMKVKEKPQILFFKKSFYLKSAILIIFILSSVYTKQHVKWLDDDSAHYKAKEYYVAGQVVYAHRKIMGEVLHPEHFLMQPYTFLQNVIYRQGVKYLPENDGERHVWANDWFLYLYTFKLQRPYGVGSDKYEPEMVKLLDQCWEALEGMTTIEIEDPKIRKKYYLSFTGLATYYSLFNGHYTGKLRNSGKISRKTDYLIAQNYKILDWLDTLGVTWEKTGLIAEIKSKYPNILAVRQGTTLDILQDLSLVITSRGEFTCDHPLIERLYQEYINAMSNDPEKNYFLLYSKTNPDQAKKTYQPSVYGAGGSSANYLLSYICGKKVPVEKFNVVRRKDPYSCNFYKKNRVEIIFSEELKPLIKGKEND